MSNPDSRDSTPPTAGVRRRMMATKRRDTPGELLIRKTLHRKGLRYAIDTPALGSSRRRADIVFRGSRVAVFVDGCFWHSCPKHRTQPRKNAAWWKAKLAENVRRDRDTDRELRSAGWVVIRVWAHEDPGRAAMRIQRVVTERRPKPKRDRHVGRGRLFPSPSRGAD